MIGWTPRNLQSLQRKFWAMGLALFRSLLHLCICWYMAEIIYWVHLPCDSLYAEISRVWRVEHTKNFPPYEVNEKSDGIHDVVIDRLRKGLGVEKQHLERLQRVVGIILDGKTIPKRCFKAKCFTGQRRLGNVRWEDWEESEREEVCLEFARLFIPTFKFHKKVKEWFELMWKETLLWKNAKAGQPSLSTGAQDTDLSNNIHSFVFLCSISSSSCEGRGARTVHFFAVDRGSGCKSAWNSNSNRNLAQALQQRLEPQTKGLKARSAQARRSSFPSVTQCKSKTRLTAVKEWWPQPWG